MKKQLGKYIAIVLVLILCTFGITFLFCKSHLLKNTKDKESINNKTSEPINKKVQDDKKDVSNETEGSKEDDVQDEEKSEQKEDNTENNTPAQEKVETPNPEVNQEIQESTTQTVEPQNPAPPAYEEPKEEPAPTTPKKTVVKEENTTEYEFLYEKYGTKFNKKINYVIKTYSDGTTEKVEVSSVRPVIDASGFNGTASSMLAEAKTLVAENMGVYNDVLSYVNTYRAEVGAAPLTLDPDLTLAATIRAMEMAYTDNMSHTRPNGTSCFTIFEELGLQRPNNYGENAAAGYLTAQAAAEGWRTSTAGHYENMINKNYMKIGIGMIKLSGSSLYAYWDQLLGS